MARSKIARLERTLGAATRFLEEVRAEIERSAPEGADMPPRLRCVHERPGHATPEYRTVGISVPEGLAGASPEVLSGLIVRYAAEKSPTALVLALDLVLDSGNGPEPVLVSEARDGAGTRLFWMQAYRVDGGSVVWEEPAEGGWRDPGEEEMILDAAFQVLAVRAAQPAAPARRRRAGGRRDSRDGVGRARSGGTEEAAPLGMAADAARDAGAGMEAPGRETAQE